MTLAAIPTARIGVATLTILLGCIGAAQSDGLWGRDIATAIRLKNYKGPVSNLICCRCLLSNSLLYTFHDFPRELQRCL